MIRIAMVDDHILMRNALARAINRFEGYTVVLQADNGRHFIELLDAGDLPALVLMDVTMPLMNGFETARWLSDNHPSIKVIALSMLNDEKSVIGMLRNGAKGFLLKDTDLEDLKKALDEVSSKGIYLNEVMHRNVLQNMNRPSSETVAEIEKQVMIHLTEREKEFLHWLCTDMSYKEIAAAMFLSPRTIDGYRDSLFDKLKVASRVGLVLFAVRNGIAS